MNERNLCEITRSVVWAQSLLGLGAHVAFALPYLRAAHGLERLQPQRRYLFVSNHVSLLDTILLGALCWRSDCYPIAVLGDRRVWHASWIRRLLSSRIGFLLERGKLNLGRVRELQMFARAGNQFHLLVFPEGTRGDGVNVGPCQPGLHVIAQEARLPIVPVFIENMQFVSTKTGHFHPFGGLGKVEIHFGEPIPSRTYSPLTRDEFLEFIRRSIASAKSTPQAAHSSLVESVASSCSRQSRPA